MKYDPTDKPYVFHHIHGKLTVFASSPKAAIKRAKQMADGYRVVPAFATTEDVHA